MVQTFMSLLRLSFALDEKKFRALVHIHEYHQDTEVREFWSALTSVPVTQFNKSYLKPHTKKRQRENYRGCITIRYYDAKIARELRAIYNVFARQFI